MFKSVNPEG